MHKCIKENERLEDGDKLDNVVRCIFNSLGEIVEIGERSLYAAASRISNPIHSYLLNVQALYFWTMLPAMEVS